MQDSADKPVLAKDLLDGGAEICMELYGSATRADLRRLYHQKDQLPVFQLDDSGTIYALRSRLRAHLEAKSAEKEARIAAAANKTTGKPIPVPPRRRRRARPSKAA
jgi:hypothetical protein